ncbi:haloacid dehalogenase [Streptomyces sp. CNQ-509]|uniref:haloacid dehalogenase type II n=1 Tax=Streptomyces sp. CNQ-509 TaxID=444103 RepID=UPI00062DD029|nr:haloacid dehalogenase type II [Streptomyces sp. CNQ-509]AKH81239.1 haloacid dehalogenase [Streptomyces sp. CNQ-509]
MTGAEFDPGSVRALAFDIFGTTVDWRTGVAEQVARLAARRGVELDGAGFADEWREMYLPSMGRVNSGERGWAYLDVLHRESLDELLERHGVGAAFGDADRAELVRAWHRLPAWDDAAAGLTRLRGRYVVAALSNGGFALLTHLVKAAGLPFDCILSAELAQHYKPDPSPYLTAARLLDVAPGELLMVACHGWDLAGARDAGLRTAFVSRPLEKGPGGGADADVPADVAARDFTLLADLLGCP